MKRTLYVLGLFLAGTALAQESATYKIISASLNAGGRPAGGVVAESATYRLSLDAIGDAAIGSGLSSAGSSLDGGLVGSFPPPGEVANLVFTDATTLFWSTDPSAGDYGLYQGNLGSPFDPGFGICVQPPPPITIPMTTVAMVPSVGHGLFYLVTARNRLAEEGTKGFTSAGVQRANTAPCP